MKLRRNAWAAGAPPRPPLESLHLQHSPIPRGPTSKGKGRGDGKEGEGKGTPHFWGESYALAAELGRMVHKQQSVRCDRAQWFARVHNLGSVQFVWCERGLIGSRLWRWNWSCRSTRVLQSASYGPVSTREVDGAPLLILGGPPRPAWQHPASALQWIGNDIIARTEWSS